MERVIDSIVVRTDLAKIVLKSVPDKPGTVGDIFTKLGELGYNVEAIAQTGAAKDRCDVTFAVQANEAQMILEYLHQRLEAWDAKGVLVDRNLALIVLFGQKLATMPGIAGRVFGILGGAKVNIDMISAGLMSLSLMVPRDRAEAALRAIKEGFELA